MMGKDASRAFRVLLLLLLGKQAAAWASFDKVLLDDPRKLILELQSPVFQLKTTAQSSGIQVTCEDCAFQDLPGAPDLPVYRFNIISGADLPQIHIHIIESETKNLPEGPTPCPNWISSSHSVYQVNPMLYQMMASFTGKVSDLRLYRGIPIRTVEIPLAIWSEATKAITLGKRLKIEVIFPEQTSKPNLAPLDPNLLKELKNPVGGRFIRRESNSSSLFKRGSRASQLGDQFIKIKIGDRNLGHFDEDQVYGIAFADLEMVKANLAGVLIHDLRLYAGPNDTLSRLMGANISSGFLNEIPIEAVDRNRNNIFDAGDSLYFFGHGTSIWKKLAGNSGPIRYEFSADPYAFENNYYLDYSAIGKFGPSLRLTSSPDLALSLNPISHSNAYLRAEKDRASGACDVFGNIKDRHLDEETGMEWYWIWKGRCNAEEESTLTLSRNSLSGMETDSLPNLFQGASGDSIFLGLYLAGESNAGDFTPYMGGNGIPMRALPDHSSPGNYFVHTGPLKPTLGLPIDSLVWRVGHRFVGFTLVYPKLHKYVGKAIWIFPTNFGKPVSYLVKNGAGKKCLRVEDGVATKVFRLNAEGIFTDSLDGLADVRYYVYDLPVKVPEGHLELANHPIRGTAIRDLVTGDGQKPEYLIITPQSLLAQALELRDFRNRPSSILTVKTSVVTVEDIYRQFSGGRMSPPAIRDFLRWALNEWGEDGAGEKALKYVLLFGDGHYDYRSIKASEKRSPPVNLIPPFEFHPIGSAEELASDDFYVALDTADNYLKNPLLDLALGRLPIQTADQGENYIRKIKDYEDPTQAGEWRGRIVLTADDGTQRGAPGNIDLISAGHTTWSESIGKTMTANQPGLTIKTVYLLDYPLNSAFSKPEATQDLLALINHGALVVHYFGHGAADQWADEVLLKTNDALSRMHNRGKTPMINAFSCTVGRFESLNSSGMSEQFVKQKDGGAIAALSSTRESFPHPNFALAKAFYRRALPPDSSGMTMTIGQAIQFSKNSSETDLSAVNDLKYVLLGEPIILLRRPHLGISLLQSPDTLKALDCGTLKGWITGGSGEGFVNLKILAGSNHKAYIQTGIDPQFVDRRGNILFDQTVPYNNFVFSVEYLIPKQISFGDSTAQILAFAWDPKQSNEGTLAKNNLRIQGVANTCQPDLNGLGPHIHISGCQKSETGAVDFPHRVKLSLPYCLQITVEDSLGGVMTSEGPDEGTTLEIPGTLDPYHPQPGRDDLFTKTYQLTLTPQSIKPGEHRLKVSARDGYGNLASRQMLLELTLDSSVQMVSAFNVPNPLKRNGTVFHFASVLPAEEINYFSTGAVSDRVEFEVKVFNQSGKLVKVFKRALSGQTTWDGRDEWRQLLANGVYFYQVMARQSLASLGGTHPSYRTVSSKRNVLILSR